MREIIRFFFLIVFALVCAGAASSGRATDVAPAQDSLFARVDGVEIGARNFDAQLTLTIRNKYFHRRPPDDQLGALKREAGDALIDRVLLIAEAKRRGLAAEPDALRAALDKFEADNRDNPRWQESRQRLLPALEKELADDLLLKRIEKSVRTPPEPEDETLRNYYQDHTDAFTEPERLRLSIILLKVDPGLPSEEKAKILDQGKSLHRRLLAGEDFATLARQYSNDESAARGGDMGYVHRGMLGEDVHKVLESLSPGAISEPLVLMEGVAILRLDERVPARLKDFANSKARAAALWKREEAERRWVRLKAELRKSATIEILDRERYPGAEAGKP